MYEQKVMDAKEAGKLLPEAAERILKWLTQERYSMFREELKQLIDSEAWEDLNDRFYQVIPFGTGGRRGPVGLGTNRMNLITIAEGAQGVADYFKKQVKDRKPRVVIAFDTRLTSKEFSNKVAEVFCGNGFETFLFEEFRATPELSFAIRHLGCDTGVVVSASHNPPTDNGFKAYGPDGGQVVPPMDGEIIECVESVEEILEMPLDEAQSKGLLHYIGKEVDEAYRNAVLAQSLSNNRNVTIAYSPIHGVGITSVLPVLDAAGFNDVHTVEEQMIPDGHFPNVKNHIPNPEVLSAMEKPIELGRNIGADIVIASDPDADRLAVAAPTQLGSKDIRPLTGNQTGALLGWYVLEYTKRKGLLKQDHVVMTTCVTSPMLPAIARSFGVQVIDDLLVGFKYVAEQIRNLEDPDLFLFGTEESIGYMKGAYTRDKDAAVAALLVAELAAELKAQGKSLWDGLFDLYRQFGYFAAVGRSVFFEGLEGKQKMESIMAHLRSNPPAELAGMHISRIIDRLNLTDTNTITGEVKPYDAPGGHTNNLIILELNGDYRNRVAIRPSGTEPKIKFYYMLYSAPSENIFDTIKRTDGHMKRLIEATESLALSV